MIFNKPPTLIHTKALYLRTHVNGKPLGRVLVDNRSTMNAIHLEILLALGKNKDDIIAIDLWVITITGEAAIMLGVIPLLTTMGNKTSITVFFIINSTTSYKLLL